MSNVEQGSVKDIERKLAAAGFIGTGDPEQPAIQLQLMWVTSADSIVCPECQGLAGTTYDLDEAPDDIQDESHPNCRCRLMYIENIE
jgi:Phage Mu protein F like protein